MRKAALVVSVLILGRAWGAEAPPMPGELDVIFARLAVHEHGGDRAALILLDEWLRQSKDAPGLAAELEGRLVELISGKATPAGIEEACRRLSVIGTAKAVPSLARLLAGPGTAEIARYALERIPGPEAVRALRNVLPKATGNLQISLINSLGARRDGDAVAMLARLAQGSDEKAVEASVLALGEVGTAAACRTLDRLGSRPEGLWQALWEARLRCAENLAKAGHRKAAYRAYEQIHRKAPKSLIRAAALKQMAHLDPSQARSVLDPAIRSEEPVVQATAIRALAEMDGGNGVSLLRREFAQLNPRAQAQVLSVLAERGDRSLRPWFAEWAATGPVVVRLAAIEGLGRLGGGKDVPLLAALATGGEEPIAIAAAARRALIALRADDVDAVIADQLGRTEAKTRVELARAAGERGAVEANGALLQAARDADRDVRREALRALANTATEAELGALAELVAQPTSAADLREAQRTLATVLPRLEKAPWDAILDAYAKASEPDPRAALLAAMTQAGRVEFLPLLRRELQSSDAATRRAAIVALGQWPTPEPMPELLEAARKDSSPSLRTLALRSYIRLAGLPSERSPAQAAALLGEVMKLAAQPEEKKSILALLSRVSCPEALAVAQAAAEDPAVAAEAKAAVESIRKSLQLGTMER